MSLPNSHLVFLLWQRVKAHPILIKLEHFVIGFSNHGFTTQCGHKSFL